MIHTFVRVVFVFVFYWILNGHALDNISMEKGPLRIIFIHSILTALVTLPLYDPSFDAVHSSVPLHARILITPKPNLLYTI